MPSQTTTLGPLTLPVPAGAANSRIADPAVDGLLDFFAFYLKNALDTKLANVTGTAPGQPSTNAVPAANRYAFDPTDPRAPRVQVKLPALFMWWDGRSTTEPRTLVYSDRRRDLGLLYVFNELSTAELLLRHEGLLAAVDGVLRLASERGRHPLYSYNGDPLGTPIAQSLGGIGTFAFEVGPGQVGQFGVDTAAKGGRSTKRDQGFSDAGRDYPALRATVALLERIGPETLEDPGDVAGDILVDLETNELGDMDDTVDILSGYLPAPDGSDD